jgi:hypothetical protein
VVKCQYEQKFSNDKNILCEPDKDHEDLAKKKHGGLNNFQQVFWRYYGRFFLCFLKYNSWSIGGHGWWTQVWSKKI